MSAQPLSASTDEVTHYQYVDALRGWAIFGVVLVHTTALCAPTTQWFLHLMQKGSQGVKLFYIVSAFTLFLSMRARQTREAHATTNFFIRRFFRIAPMFYTAIVIYVLYEGLAPRYWAPDGIKWWYIALTAAFQHGYLPQTITSVVLGGWSIAVEMMFYLCIPWLFTKITSLRAALLALLIALLAYRIINPIMLHFVTPCYPPDQEYLVSAFGYLWFVGQAPVFFLGIVVYHLIQRYPQKNHRLSCALLGAFALALGCLVCSVIDVDRLDRLFFPTYFLYGVALTIFVLALHFCDNKMPRLLVINPLMIFLGKISFSLYLTHFLVIDVLKNAFPDLAGPGSVLKYALAATLVFAVASAISFLTYHLIEHNGIRLGKILIAWRGKPSQS